VSFRATFVFGPLSGPAHDRRMMARRVPRRLYFAPCEAGSFPATADGWALVGTDDTQPGQQPLPAPL
jgi:hypothetical protein